MTIAETLNPTNRVNPFAGSRCNYCDDRDAKLVVLCKEFFELDGLCVQWAANHVSIDEDLAGDICSVWWDLLGQISAIPAKTDNGRMMKLSVARGAMRDADDGFSRTRNSLVRSALKDFCKANNPKRDAGKKLSDEDLVAALRAYAEDCE